MTQQKEFYAILDNLRSLHNVGSIFRTAEALGFKKIFLSGFTPAPITDRQKREIHKTALGAEDYLSWEKISQTWRLLKKLKEENFYLIGLEVNRGGVSLKQLKLPKNCQKIALIVGNEVKGLSRSTLNYCQKIVEIPMKGRKESLNVAVAFGIAGFYLINL